MSEAVSVVEQQHQAACLSVNDSKIDGSCISPGRVTAARDGQELSKLRSAIARNVFDKIPGINQELNSLLE